MTFIQNSFNQGAGDESLPYAVQMRNCIEEVQLDPEAVKAFRLITEHSNNFHFGKREIFQPLQNTYDFSKDESETAFENFRSLLTQDFAKHLEDFNFIEKVLSDKGDCFVEEFTKLKIVLGQYREFQRSLLLSDFDRFFQYLDDDKISQLEKNKLLHKKLGSSLACMDLPSGPPIKIYDGEGSSTTVSTKVFSDEQINEVDYCNRARSWAEKIRNLLLESIEEKLSLELIKGKNAFDSGFILQDITGFFSDEDGTIANAYQKELGDVDQLICDRFSFNFCYIVDDVAESFSSCCTNFSFESLHDLKTTFLKKEFLELHACCLKYELDEYIFHALQDEYFALTKESFPDIWAEILAKKHDRIPAERLNYSDVFVDKTSQDDAFDNFER